MRLTSDDAPAIYKGTADLDSWLPGGEYLISITEFGVHLAWRESAHETWSPPLVMKDVTR